MNKVYERINWQNYPNTDTAINDVNLNKMDYALNELDDRLISQDTTKADKTTLNNLISNWVIDEETGVITITKFNGEQILFDLNLEKVPVSFVLSDDGILIMTTDDGTTFTANIGAMIPILTFNDSDDIAVSVSGSGVNKTYSFSIKTGAITEDKLQPNYLADVKVQVENAKGHSQSASDYASNSHYDAQLSQSYAIGGSGIREGEDTDNSKYYYEQTKGIATGDTSDSYVTFTSDDMANPTDYTDVNLLASGEKHSSLFGKISTMFKNIRYIYKMLGATDISSIGNGTVTGGISVLNSNLNTKQDTITGGASTITGSNLTASRALVSNSSGKVAVSAVTSTELGYLDGVTSNIQTQLDNLKNTSFDKNAASNTDFNTLKTNGIYAVGTTGDSYHAPTSNGGVLCVFASNSYILQVYFTTSAAAKVYYRTFIGSWGAWVTIK